MRRGAGMNSSFLPASCKGRDRESCGFVCVITCVRVRQNEKRENMIKPTLKIKKRIIFRHLCVCVCLHISHFCVEDQEQSALWLILPLFPTFASSKGDTVILNTIKKAQPWHRCNQTDWRRRNEDVNSGCCIRTFIYCPFPILSVSCRCEGCVYKTGWMTGLTYQAWVIQHLVHTIHPGKAGWYM